MTVTAPSWPVVSLNLFNILTCNKFSNCHESTLQLCKLLTTSLAFVHTARTKIVAHVKKNTHKKYAFLRILENLTADGMDSTRVPHDSVRIMKLVTVTTPSGKFN